MDSEEEWKGKELRAGKPSSTRISDFSLELV